MVRSGLSLSTPWLGMTVILPLGILVQVHRNGYFLRRRPPNLPSPRRLWLGQAGQSLPSPSCLPSPSTEGPKSMVNFPGDFFSVKSWRHSKCFGTPQKNPCKNPCKRLCKPFLQTIREEVRAKKKSGKKPFKKSVQKNPCKTSVQKSPCRKSQGRIFAVWILAAKVPNSDLNFAVDFLVDFFLLFFQGKRPEKNPPKNPPQNSPGTLFGKIPLGFLQKPFLEKIRAENPCGNPCKKSVPNKPVQMVSPK